MKKIIFFDGDGTLWYPKTTKRRVKPFWIYLNEETKDNFLDHLEVAPEVVKTLATLKDKGIKLIILSTHPDKLENAGDVLKSKVDHFDLHRLFDEYHVTAEYPEAKGEKIVELLEKFDLTQKDALMVGDSYRWDIEPAINSGIDAVLIDSDYNKEHLDNEPAKNVIAEINEILNYI